MRAERDQATTDRCLQRLAETAASPAATTMPAILECVESQATIGEICDTLRAVFGVFEPAR